MNSINFLRLLTALLVAISAGVASAQTEFWQQTNGPYGGFIRALAGDSTGQMFAGTADDGLFRSSDGGATWSTTSVNAAIVYTLALNTEQHIFAGTNGGHVYRSTDKGNTWQQFNVGLYAASVRAIAINRDGHVFVAVAGEGIFRSTDNGARWIEVNTGLTNADVYALATNSTGHVFAGTFGGGVFRSTNNGENWAQINNGLPNTFVNALAINKDDHIFAGTEGGVFRSVDNGDSWSASLTSTMVTYGQVRVLALAINGDSDVFAGTEYSGGIWRSENNGNTWNRVSTGLTNQEVYALAVNRNDHIFAGTFGGGVFRSTDNGENWHQANAGIVSTWVRALALAPGRDGPVFAGTFGGGVFRSIDNGDTWIKTGLMESRDAYVQALAVNRNGHIFAGKWSGGPLFRSTDNGNSWIQVGRGLNTQAVEAIAVNKEGDIFAGTRDGVFLSTDNGNNWSHAGLSDNGAQSLAIDSAGTVFAGAYNAGVFRSTDNGDNWQPINNGLTDTNINALAVNNAGHIFAGTLSNGVFRSTNGGDSWQPATFGLTHPSVDALAINNDGHIFAGTGLGVFRSTNNGENWSPFNSGLTNLSVRSLAIDSAGTVFAGTWWGGVFRLTPANLPPAAPTGLTAESDFSKIVLRWNRNLEGDLLHYRIYRSTGSPANALIDSVHAGTETYLDENVVSGTTYYYRITAVDKTRIESNFSNQVQVAFVANRPPLIVHSPFSTRQSGEEIPVRAEITDDLGITGAMLHYRRGGDPVFNSVAMPNNGNSYQAAIPDNAVTSRGVEYFIVAADAKSVISRLPASGFFSIQVRVTNETKPSPQPGGSSQTAYRLISVPLDLDNKNAKAVLEDDLGKYDDTKWRFSEFPANQTYAEISEATMITPGKAFWLLVKDAGKVIDTGAGRSNATAQRYVIPLHPAWNFVANPFNFPIPVENISLKRGKPLELRSYTGNWN
ncbi:MAG: YCF48-related protein, partial [bacterium]